MKKETHKPTRQYGGVDADQRQAERREKLLAAGLELFGVIGYTQATIKGLCQKAGLTERYFYESFKNKEELLSAVHKRLTDTLEAGADMIFETPGITPEDAVYQITKSFYRLFLNDPRRARVQLFEVLGVSPRVDEEYQDAIRRLADQIERNINALFPDLDREWLQTTIIPMTMTGGLILYAQKWVLDGFQTPIDDIVSQSIEMMMAIGTFYQNQRVEKE